MTESSTKRLPRLAAIVTMLQTKRIVTATELAAKFGVSVRTVYRDIRALEESGIPIVTEEGKGYALAEGYKLPPVMFTEREANALITAAQMVLRSKDASLVREFSEAVSKIKAVLRYAQKDRAELLADRVYVGKNYDLLITSHSLMDIQMALTGFRLVRIAYTAAEGEVSERVIEPFALYTNADEEWVLAAYCRLRRDFRAFRLDRMARVEVLDEPFEPHRMTIGQYVEKYVRNK